MSLESTLSMFNKIEELKKELRKQSQKFDEKLEARDKEISELKRAIALNSHKVKFYDECIINNSCIKMKDCYQELGFKSTKALGDYLIELGMCYRANGRLMFKPGFENYFGYRQFRTRGFSGMHLVLRPEGLEMLRMSCPNREE